MKQKSMVRKFWKSSQMCQSLRLKQKFLGLPQQKLQNCVITRWNSVCSLLQRNVKHMKALLYFFPVKTNRDKIIKQHYQKTEGPPGEYSWILPVSKPVTGWRCICTLSALMSKIGCPSFLGPTSSRVPKFLEFSDDLVWMANPPVDVNPVIQDNITLSLSEASSSDEFADLILYDEEPNWFEKSQVSFSSQVKNITGKRKRVQRFDLTPETGVESDDSDFQ